MIHYVCKYTPTELFQGFGEKCAVLEEMPENFEMSDQIAHANLCGFGKSVIQAVLEGKAEELVLVNCCDSMRRVYDIVESTGKCKFLYMLDIPHDDEECEKVKFAASICRLKEAYEEYSGKKFDKSLFLKAFEQKDTENKPYIAVRALRVLPAAAGRVWAVVGLAAGADSRRAVGAAAAAFRRVTAQGAVRDVARCADDCVDCPAGAAAHARTRRGAAVPARERLHDDD